MRRANTLAGSGAELQSDYAGFEADFFEFIADAQRYAESCRAQR
nr:hypothetical protein [Aromatoleum bremense]